MRFSDKMASSGWILTFFSFFSLAAIVNGFTEEQWLTAVMLSEARYEMDEALRNETAKVVLHDKDIIVMPPGLSTVVGINDYRDALKANRTAEQFYWIRHTHNEVLFHTKNTALVLFVFNMTFSPEVEPVSAKGIALLQRDIEESIMEMKIWNYDLPF